jgi:hypothetical protein
MPEPRSAEQLRQVRLHTASALFGPYRPFGIVAQLTRTCRSFGAQHLD